MEVHPGRKDEARLLDVAFKKNESEVNVSSRSKRLKNITYSSYVIFFELGTEQSRAQNYLWKVNQASGKTLKPNWGVGSNRNY
jgi:hypothetical protein